MHAWDPIHREAHRLVHGDEQVEQQHRNDKCIDHRCGQNHSRSRTQDVAQQPRFQEPVLRNHDVLETHDAVVHHVVELDASLGEGHLELLFQGAN